MRRPNLWTRLFKTFARQADGKARGLRRSTFAPRLMELEDRVVPAGNVNTFFDALGNFVIEGDAEANDITITQNAFGDGSIAIQGNNGTKLNGRDDPIAEDITNRNVIILMKGGDDVVNITGDIKFDRIFRVDLGTGNTKLIGGSGKLAVTENFVIVNRAKKGQVANKEVALAQEPGDQLEVGGKFAYKSGGFSNDDFKIGSGEIDGDFNFFSGKGSDNVDISLDKVLNAKVENAKLADAGTFDMFYDNVQGDLSTTLNGNNLQLNVTVNQVTGSVNINNKLADAGTFEMFYGTVQGDLAAKLKGKNVNATIEVGQVDGTMSVNVQSRQTTLVDISGDQVNNANIKTGSNGDVGVTTVQINEVLGSLNIQNTGKAHATVLTDTKVNGDVDIKHTGSQFSSTILDKVDVVGTTSLTGSDFGFDNFSLLASTVKDLVAAFLGGNDILSFGKGLFDIPSQQTYISGSVNIDMGPGNDSITLGGQVTPEKANFNGFPQTVNLDGGSGFDTVKNGNLAVFDVENFKKSNIEENVFV